ncbi:Polynucleotidyl transferase, ribonuclease H superfamily protein [Trifolium repens]|nr:Polynucleotidyl transferase, ribonuclease H superfamily protein [Trifolium repens]
MEHIIINVILQRCGTEALWCRVLRGKYERGNISIDEVNAKVNDSSLWKTLVKLWPELIKHQYWSIGDGTRASAWSSRWLHDGICIEEIIDEVPVERRYDRVKDLIDEDGLWSEDRINWLPTHIRDNIKAVVPPSAELGSDQCLWQGNSRGEFTVSSAYKLLKQDAMFDGYLNDDWASIWKLQIHERVRCFIWILCHGRILTQQQLHYMHLSDPFCHRCNLEIESILHAMRDCPHARAVWLHLVPRALRAEFFVVDLSVWIKININYSVEDENQIKWCSLWAVTCHSLWMWRNKESHDSNISRPPDLWRWIRKIACDYKLAIQEGKNMERGRKTLVNIGWTPPTLGWVKINTDGSRRRDGRAGCGGLIRGETKEWLGGFSKFIGLCSAFVAELWGVFEGLKLAQIKGFEKVEICVDSQAVINGIRKGDGGNAMGFRLVQRIRQMLELNWEVSISYNYREANRCADGLANLAFTLLEEIEYYDVCPDLIKSLYDDDVSGVTTPRLVIM